MNQSGEWPKNRGDTGLATDDLSMFSWFPSLRKVANHPLSIFLAVVLMIWVGVLGVLLEWF